MKDVIFLGSSLDDIRQFPREAQRQVGFQMHRLQVGDQPQDFKPMPSVGRGVYEIRVRAGGAYRAFYVSKFEEGIYILHAFQKKTRKTSPGDLKIGQQRYQQLIQERP